MKKFLMICGLMFSLTACEIDVSGGGGANDGNDNLNTETLKITVGDDYKENITEYDSANGFKSELVKKYAVDSNAAMTLQGGGGSYFALGCSGDPDISLDLVRFDASGNEIERTELNYQSFTVEQGEVVEIQNKFSGIDEACMAISYTFYVGLVE